MYRLLQNWNSTEDTARKAESAQGRRFWSPPLKPRAKTRQDFPWAFLDIFSLISVSHESFNDLQSKSSSLNRVASRCKQLEPCIMLRSRASRTVKAKGSFFVGQTLPQRASGLLVLRFNGSYP